MTDRKKHFYVSWDQFHRDVRALAEKLDPIESIHTIIAITRGGLIPAGIIARELGIRTIETVSIASYDHQAQDSLKVLKPIAPEILARVGTGEGVLVVDDLVDTGATGRLLKTMLPDSCLATVYAKPQGREVADVYVMEVPQETWIFFPWDIDFAYADPIRKGITG